MYGGLKQLVQNLRSSSDSTLLSFPNIKVKATLKATLGIVIVIVIVIVIAHLNIFI